MQLRQHNSLQMHPDLVTLLGYLRQDRGFNAQKVLEAKLAQLVEYFKKHKLEGAVVGVSGGIDSAVVAHLLSLLKRIGVIRVLTLMALPCTHSKGVTGQREALKRAFLVANACGMPLTTIEMDGVVERFVTLQEVNGSGSMTDWAEGQAVAYLRTPFLYAATSINATYGFPSIVVGTTNRDEGAYLGYVGKAADGMVDLQPIADLHKSEVYALARLLGVPEEVINVTPTGDMFDGQPDTEVFGAPYDFVELALLWKSMLDGETQVAEFNFMCKDAQDQFMTFMGAIEKLHEFNSHKYLIGSPSVFLDTMERYVPGGWEEKLTPKRSTVKANMASPFLLQTEMNDRASLIECGYGWGLVYGSDEIFQWRNVIHPFSQQQILKCIRGNLMVPAPDDGRWQRPVAPEDVGSWRSTFEDQEFANAIWNQLRKRLPQFRRWKTEPNTDIDDTSVWRPVGVSPVFRVIRYPESGGALIPHYDAPFIESKNRRTLMSCVISIDGEGELQIFNDQQQILDFDDRDFSDEFARDSAEFGVYKTLVNSPGDMIVFDHRLLHAPINFGARTIIRTDVIFERSV